MEIEASLVNPWKKISTFIKEKKGVIVSTLGEIIDLKQIGQGGNGLVYGGLLNNQEVAIKFLAESSDSKLLRFKAEYFNITLLRERNNIVNYINYEEIQLEDGYKIPIIIMKRYEKSLKKFREDDPEINETQFIKLFNFLLNSLKTIHQQGIVHRDIKPENILVTKDNDFVLSDFGIASYNPDIFTLKAETRKEERLANYEFSAPEQASKDVKPAPSMDIYALGQVCQWYVFGKTHRGTNRKRISEMFNSLEIEVLDIIINKCLHNNFEERYQNINEIIDHIKELKESREKVDPFEEMYLLNDVIRATCPSIAQGIQYVSEEKYIKRLIENINKKTFQRNLWFNTGIGNSDINNLEYLGYKRILLDNREIKIKGIWLYIGSSYDDLIILETEDLGPFVIDGKETYYALIVNEKHLVESYHLDSGYIEIDDEVFSIRDLKIDERNRSNDYKFYFIGTQYHSSIIFANDNILREFQELVKIDKDNVNLLIRKLRKNKHEEVYYRL